MQVGNKHKFKSRKYSSITYKEQFLIKHSFAEIIILHFIFSFILSFFVVNNFLYNPDMDALHVLDTHAFVKVGTNCQQVSLVHDVLWMSRQHHSLTIYNVDQYIF